MTLGWTDRLDRQSDAALKLARRIIKLSLEFESFADAILQVHLVFLRREYSMHSAILTLFRGQYLGEAGILLRAQMEGHSYSLYVGHNRDRARAFLRHRDPRQKPQPAAVVLRLKREFESAYDIGPFAIDLYGVLSQIAHANPVGQERGLFLSRRPKRTWTKADRLRAKALGLELNRPTESEIVSKTTFHFLSLFLLISECRSVLTLALNKCPRAPKGARHKYSEHDRVEFEMLTQILRRLVALKRKYSELARSWNTIVTRGRTDKLIEWWEEVGFWGTFWADAGMVWPDV